MKDQGLYELFLEELSDLYSAESQIVQALPKVISAASFKDLKNALNKNLEDTKNHITRIKKVFAVLKASQVENNCEAMQGLLRELDELISSRPSSSTLDAAIICGVQKVEHYGIASYGTLHSFAYTLGLDSEIIDLLQDSSDEKGAADKRLTKIAEGSFFSTGINKVASESSTTASR